MKIYTLVGKSGTGKSFHAMELCRKKNIESIIDDGLFIYRNTVVAGISAKREATKIGAVKVALFQQDAVRDEVAEAIGEKNPASILILGTSLGMTDKIILRLGLLPDTESLAQVERIFIEDITTEEEREIAQKQRMEMGQHVIPAPTFQLKRQFSGYFMSPMKSSLHLLKKGIGPWKEPAEKSVVRPTFSYLGGYEISEKVMSDIAACVQQELGTVSDLVKVVISSSRVEKDEGVELNIVADFKYGPDLPTKAEEYQKRLAEQIEAMTMFNVAKVNLNVQRLV